MVTYSAHFTSEDVQYEDTHMKVKSPFKSITLVIPAYNEEKFIAQTIEKVLASDTAGLAKEIIIVNDGSTDATVKNALTCMKKIASAGKKLVKKSKKSLDVYSCSQGKHMVYLYDKKVNGGKGSAVKTGFMASTGDIVMVQDADLEYDPSDYPRLLEPFMTHGADVVFGSRFMSDRPHRVLYFWHYVGNSVLTLISNMFTDLNLTDMETGYKVFRGDIIRTIAPTLVSTSFGFEPEITAKVAKNKEAHIFEVGISYRGRTYKEGKKLFWWKDGLEALIRIIQFNVFS